MRDTLVLLHFARLFTQPGGSVASGPSFSHPTLHHGPHRLGVRQCEDDVTYDDVEDCEGLDVVDERRTHAPADREELEPLQNDTGGQHDHDGAADKK